MASFNHIKILSFYFLIYFKFAHTIADAIELSSAAPGNGNLDRTSASTPKVSSEGGSSQEVTAKDVPPLDHSKITILVEDPNDSSKTVENDTGQYDLKDENNVLEYKFKDKVKCTGVEYDGKEVWKRDTSNSENPYPSSAFFSLRGRTAIVYLKENGDVSPSVNNVDTFNGSINILMLENDKWTSIFSGKPELKWINVLFKKQSVNYNYEVSGKIHTCTAKDNVLFDKVRSWKVSSGNHEIIFETDQIFECVNKVVYDETDSENLVATTYHVNGLKRTYKKPKNGQWNKGAESFGCISKEVDLDENSYLKHTFGDKNRCTCVKYDGKEVWTRDESKSESPYPESVVFAVKGNTAIVRFKELVSVFRFESNEWKVVFSGKPVPKSLNLLFKASCENYDCVAEGKVYTYKAKKQTLFNKVRRHTGDAKDSEEVIFETDNVLDMANEVVYDETESKKLIVTIYHLNGLKRTFRKESGFRKPKTWTETQVTDSGTTLSKDKVEILNEQQISESAEHFKPEDVGPESNDVEDSASVVTQDPDAGQHPKPQSAGEGIREEESELNGAEEKLNTEITVSEDQPSESTEQSESVDTKEQTVKDTDVTERQDSEDEKPEEGEDKKLEDKPALKETDAPYVEEADPHEMGEHDETSAKQGRRVPSALLGTIPVRRIPVHLDIRTRTSTKQFDYSESAGYLIYSAKDDYYFRSVNNGDTEVWHGGSIDGSAIKVVAELNSSSSLIGLTLHLVSNEIKRFKYSNGRLDEVAFEDPLNLPPDPLNPRADVAPKSGATQTSAGGSPRDSESSGPNLGESSGDPSTL